MFLHVLTAGEQAVFCQLAYVVMAADGQVHDKETAFHEWALRDLELEELPPPPDGSVEVPAGLFGSAASRHALLLELAVVAAADGVVTAGEREVLESLAGELDSSPAAVDRYLEYADRLVDVLEEGVILVAEGH